MTHIDSTHDSRPKSTTKTALFTGLVVSFVAYYLASILRLFGIQFGDENPGASIVWKTLAAAILIGLIWRFEKRSLASVNVKQPSEQDVTWAFYFFGITMTWYWLASTIFPPVQSEGVNTIARLHPLIVLGIVLTSATVEELFYRGYLIERLRELTGRLWIAVIVSGVLFVYPHVQFFGTSWLLYHGVGAALLYVLYLWRKNLLAVMLLHLLGNLPILIPTLTAYFS